MTREDRPGSGRLAPLRPEYRWSTPPASVHQEPPRSYPPKRSDLVEPTPSDYEYEEGDPAARRRYDDDLYAAPAPTQARPRPRPVPSSTRYPGADEPYESEDYVEATERPPAYAPTKPLNPKVAAQRIYPTAMVDDAGRLPIQERQLLLMHTIQLYDDKWKLAGIRANQRKNWLQAYLTPRNKRVELKEAISRNQVLIITVDSRGNTEVKEPKKPRFWRRVINWLFGS